MKEKRKRAYSKQDKLDFFESYVEQLWHFFGQDPRFKDIKLLKLSNFQIYEFQKIRDALVKLCERVREIDCTKEIKEEEFQKALKVIDDCYAIYYKKRGIVYKQLLL